MKEQPAPHATALVVVDPQNQLDQATKVAEVAKKIVERTTVTIDKRRYVRVEGWSALATLHGCTAKVLSVTEDAEGTKAVVSLCRMSDGVEIARAEGSVGVDEPVWYGGKGWVRNRKSGRKEEKTYEKRPSFAIRAMAQTRGISRVCRTAFSHVIILMDPELQTTPAEEINEGDVDEINEGDNGAGSKEAASSAGKDAGAGDEKKKTTEVPRDPGVDEIKAARPQYEGGKWKTVAIHFGQKKDTKIGELEARDLKWWIKEWHPRGHPATGKLSEGDVRLRAALDAASIEVGE